MSLAVAGDDRTRAAGDDLIVGDPVVALVARAQAGDVDAFAEIYAMFAAPVHRYLRSRVREPRDAEDLLQATFLRAIEALPRWQPRGAPFSAWLFRIARNAAIDHARGHRSDIDLGTVAEAAAPGADPAERAPADLATVLAEALATLTPDQRDVISLRYFADLSGPEISRTLGKDEAAVRALQMRGLASLRRAIERREREAQARVPSLSRAEASA